MISGSSITPGLRPITVNEGTLQIANQASLPNNSQPGFPTGVALVALAPMDTGTIDMDGQNLNVGALGLPGAGWFSTTQPAATGNIINSGGSGVVLTVSENNWLNGTAVNAPRT